MPNVKDSGSSQQPSKERRFDETAMDEQLEKDADDMAEAGQKVEKQYDQDHDIFTK
jgi:hypothetical protein